MLTKYIVKISNTESYGEWIIDRENDGTLENPIHMPYVNYNELVKMFISDFYQFSNSHPEYQLTKYSLILENNGIKWNNSSMRNIDVDTLNEQCILALIMGVIRADRFSEGTLLSFFKDGYILKWLQRLKEIDVVKNRH